MWEYEHSVESAATAAEIYRFYEDVALRPQWDRSVESMTIDGPFASGASGVMVIEDQGAVPFIITEAVKDQGFTDQTTLQDAGLTLRFTHELAGLATGGTRITHRLAITGPNADTTAEEIGPVVVADFPKAMTALARIAESGR